MIANAEDGIEGLRNAVVVEKAIDRKNTHPYKTTDIIAEINRRLNEKYDEETLGKYLVYRNKTTGRPEVNSYCLRAILKKLKWRNSDNQYHYSSNNPEFHWYSEDAIEEINSKIMSAQGYLSKARGDLSKTTKKTV